MVTTTVERTCHLQQFQRRLACTFAHLTHHCCQFENAGLTLEHFYLGGGAPGMYLFQHAIVLLTKYSQLRQVSDTQHLVLAGQVTQFTTHDRTHTPADPLVDFVEDQGRHLVGTRPTHF